MFFDFDDNDENSGWFIYDDIMWWTISLARACELFKVDEYLKLTGASFSRVWYGSKRVGDTGSYVKVIPSGNKIIGYTTKNSGGVPANFKNYFVLVFDKPFIYTVAVTNGAIDAAKQEVKDKHAGAIIGFNFRHGLRKPTKR